MLSSCSTFAGVRVSAKVASRKAAARAASVVVAAERGLWFPNAAAPAYLDNSLAGDRGFDPMGLGAKPEAMFWYRQAELQNGRWAMLGVAGILAQSIVAPDQLWYNSAVDYANKEGSINLGSLLAVQFITMHWVELRRWADLKNPGSANQDPIFPANKLPSTSTPGYPGGIFDPLGFSKGDLMAAQTKEIKNGRLAMVAFLGFVFAAQTTGKGPIDALTSHLADPFSNNWAKNIGNCALDAAATLPGGVTIPTPCLWPGN
jgi:light-harvesting complex I chlorophyll a/b binding protein 4